MVAPKTRRCVVLVVLFAAVVAGVGRAQEAAKVYEERVVFTDKAAMAATVEDLSGETLRFYSPNFNEAVVSPLSRLKSIDFKSDVKAEAEDYVLIANGDRLAGKLMSIDAETVTIEVPHVGAASVPRKVVVAIVRTGARSSLVESDFAVQDLTGWQVVQGDWKVEEGRLVNTGGSRPNTIAFPLNHKEAMTFEMDFDGSPRGLHFDVYFGAAAADANPESGLMFQFSLYNWSISKVENRRAQRFANGTIPGGRNTRKAEVRITWDPETKEAVMWNGDVQMGKTKANGLPDFPDKNFLILRVNSRSTIGFIRVSPGVQEPTGASSAGALADKDVLLMQNGDRLSVDGMTLLDGEFTAQTAGLDLTFPAEAVARMITAEGNREVPRRRKGDARLALPAATLTLVPESLNGTELVGTSDYLGEVNVVREAVRRIEFNIYD